MIRALELMKKYVASKIRAFPLGEDVPVYGVVRYGRMPCTRKTKLAIPA